MQLFLHLADEAGVRIGRGPLHGIREVFLGMQGGERARGECTQGREKADQDQAFHAALRCKRRTRLTTNRAKSSRACCRRSEEHTSELQSPCNLVCRLL